ncbi:hypothetical protein [Nocardia aurantiaca]|uniref:AbiEi antitoxin C-terminal domain-containing protein n=1 Tax=Nocardia aurantiaca TaxID=2675850 RepID=A0A6I3KSR2_9NOCA|nr:hypothetical protein [Nocardia aurantiaca]MTE12992.1 hypothetical protein [Nocardia aurantiaca]
MSAVTTAGGRRCEARRSRRALLEGCGAQRGHDRPFATPLGRREQHRQLIRAVLPDMAPGTVVSHQSAAVLYGTTLWRAPLDRVCVTRNRRGGGRTRPFTKVHGSPVDSAAEIDGLLVTTPARTVVDLALTLPFDAAVVAGDALVGAFGLTPAELTDELVRAKGRYGINQAKQVITILDGRSRSVGESLSRTMIHHHALPLPHSQGDVLTPDGRFVARVAFYYDSAGVLCEFDGPTEYGRLLRPGHDLATTIHRERTRETHLRALGFEVVRWTWEELVRDRAGRRLRTALTRPRPRPDGRIEPAPATQPRPVPVRAL